MPQNTSADESDKSAAGWWNRCRFCGVGRYWVRAHDIARVPARRFASPDSSEPFICPCGREPGVRPEPAPEAQEE